MDYQFKTTPIEIQRKIFEETKDTIGYGLLWEMGVGKSKEIIDTAGYLYQTGKIDALFIVGPAGVHENWVINELPKHMPDTIAANMAAFSFSTKRSGTKKHLADVAKVVYNEGFSVLTMSYDAITTENGADAARDFLKHRQCLYAVDEARRIKNPKALRTKYVLKSSGLAKYRRLANGTPIQQGVFDLYSQLLFIDPNFWLPLGISTFTAFKTYFGVFIKGHVSTPTGVCEFPQLVGYKNIEILKEMLDKCCSRVLKEDVLKDLPPKVYTCITFEMNAEQQAVYSDLENEYIAFCGGGMVSAPLALTRLLRLQQVISGYVPVQTNDGSDLQPLVDLGSTNPRLDLVSEIIEDLPHKAILWCRFTRTIDKVMEMAKKQGISAVRYDGSVKHADREAAILGFQEGEHRLFVANAATAGEGITLTAAKTVIYIENTFNLAERLQSEDRAHRMGQDRSVQYIDIVGRKTVDEHISKCLQKKLDISSEITGDPLRLLSGSLV